MKRLLLAIPVFLLLLTGTEGPYASAPVYKSVTGCVINGKLHSLRKGNTAAGQSAIIVYPMKVKGIRLDRYEGRKVTVSGYLHPGDRFDADPGTVQIIGPCDEKSRKAILGR